MVSPGISNTTLYCRLSIILFVMLLIFRLDKGSMYVLAGDNRRTEGIRYDIEEAVPHSGYSLLHHWADLALLKLSKSIQYSNKIKPICLPSAAPTEGKICHVAGWGRTAVCKWYLYNYIFILK